MPDFRNSPDAVSSSNAPKQIFMVCALTMPWRLLCRGIFGKSSIRGWCGASTPHAISRPLTLYLSDACALIKR